MCLETLKDDNDLDKDIKHSLFKTTSKAELYSLNINDLDNIFDNPVHFDKLINMLKNAGSVDEIEINISSHGGYACEMMKLENIIKCYFYNRITTILNPVAYSAAALLFLIGNSRVIFENSQIMFHDVSFGVFGKHSDIKTRHDFDKKFWDSQVKTYLKLFLNNTEIDQLLSGKEFWFDAFEMCKRGVATDIMIFGTRLTAKEYVDYCTNDEQKIKLLNKIKDEYELSSNDIARIDYELGLIKLDNIKNNKKKKIKKIKKK